MDQTSVHTARLHICLVQHTARLHICLVHHTARLHICLVQHTARLHICLVQHTARLHICLVQHTARLHICLMTSHCTPAQGPFRPPPGGCNHGDRRLTGDQGSSGPRQEAVTTATAG
ncbi:unnamed protein product [Gadus morhua 'NCC']